MSACADVDDADELDLGEQSEALCTGVTLSSNASGPVSAGTSVSLTAGSTCGMGESAEYQFAMRREGSNATTVIRAWAASNTATWNTTGLASGKWSILVSARPVGTTIAQHQAITVYVGNVCINPTLSPSPTTAGPGATVALTASSTCSSGTPEYRFLVRAPGSAAYVEARTWGAAAYSWNTTGLAVGTYSVKVESRAVGNGAVDGTAQVSYILKVACGAGLTASASPLAAAVGVPVTLTATTSCNAVGVTSEVRFSYRLSTQSTFTVLRDWSSAATATWNTAALSPGNYTMRVEARAPGSTAITSKTFSYTLGGSCSALTMTVSPGSPRDVGTVLALTGAATCSAGVTPQYRFVMRTPLSTNDVQLRDWGSSATFSWNTTGAMPGRYELIVQARANATSTSNLVRSSIFRLGKMCTSATATLFPGTTQVAGAPLTVNAVASCYFSGTAEYRFSSRLVGSDTWNLIRTWSTQASAPIETNLAAGSYEVLIEVKGLGMLGEAQGSRTVGYTLTATCSDGFKNAAETDMDCGGGTCGLCNQGQTCLANGDCNTQSCAEGVCQPSFCPALPHPAEGVVQLNDDLYQPAVPAGSYTATYVCAPGYQDLFGGNGATQANVSCANGAWLGTEVTPICVPLTCSFVALEMYGIGDVRAGDGFNAYAYAECAGLQAEYRFLSRRAWTNEWTVVRDWSTDHTVRVETNAQASFEDHQLRAEARVLGHSGEAEGSDTLPYNVIASCYDGAKNGSETAVDCGGPGGCMPCAEGQGCRDNWDCNTESCQDGICRQPTCAPLAHPENGYWTDWYGVGYLSQPPGYYHLEYTCAPGFMPAHYDRFWHYSPWNPQQPGYTNATCESGAWQMFYPVACIRVDCGPPPEVEHARQGWNNGTGWLSFMQYDCDLGYESWDERFTYCTEYGWTLPPQCSPRQCYTGQPAEYLSTVWTGDNPQAIAVNPLTHKAYVGNHNAGTLSVINGRDGGAIHVEVGRGPSSVGINTQTNRIYVANYGTSENPDNTISVIDGNTDTVIATLTVSANPYNVAVDEARNKIYVTQYGWQGQSLTVIDGESHGTTEVMLEHAQPEQLLVNPVTDKVYVTHVDGFISVLDGGTHELTYLDAGSRMTGLDINTQTNELYFAHYDHEGPTGWITKLDGFTNELSQIGVGANPVGVAVDEARNRIFVANSGDSTVTVIDGETRSTLAQVTLSGNLLDVEIDPGSGDAYVSAGVVTYGINAANWGSYIINEGGGSYLAVDTESAFLYIGQATQNTVAIASRCQQQYQ